MFNADEIKHIHSLIDNKTLDKGFIESDDNVVSEIRDSNIFFLPSSDEEFQFVFRRCVDYIDATNRKYFQVDIDRIQNLQYTIYNKGQFYEKHIDMTNVTQGVGVRKLSFSVQLTDPKEYEGGDLVLFTGPEVWTAPKELGCVTFFPSYLLHEVTPVTKGERRSLVGWVTGPKWK
jgi:PKHD-type hydroxylase